MRKITYVLFVISATVTAVAAGTIKGTLLDANNIPVKHMIVKAFPVSAGWSGGVPQSETDDQGHFSIAVPTGPKGVGLKWNVYPEMRHAGYYPNLALSFYNTTINHGEFATLDSDHPDARVDLRLGPRAGAVMGNVTDAVTGAPVKPYFEFAWASDRANRMGESTSHHYRVLLPSNTDVVMTVSSRGYKQWTYPGVINVGPGQDFRLDIQLQPEQKR